MIEDNNEFLQRIGQMAQEGDEPLIMLSREDLIRLVRLVGSLLPPVRGEFNIDLLNAGI